MKTVQTYEEYKAIYPKETQEILDKIRATIRSVAPDATEKISYGIPTLWQGRNVVHFAAYDHHIGFYPGPGAIDTFKEDAEKYRTSKGTLQFPLDKPIPYDLIKNMTTFRVSIETARKQKA